MALTPAQLITQLYIGYYDRAPDPAGLNYWVGIYNSGQSILQIAEYFSVQNESLAAYPYLQNPNIVSPSDFITQVYQNLFDRDPDPAGLAYWIDQLETGAVTVGGFIATVQFSANSDPTTNDYKVLNNKTTVGLDYAVSVGTAGVEWSMTSAKDVVSQVGLSDASVAAGLAKTDQFVADGGGAPMSFDLQPGTDTFTGKAGDDVFTAEVQQTGLLPIQTLNNTDKLDGGGGRNTLNAQLVNLFTIPASLKNIQEVNIDGAPGFIVPPVVLDVLHADSIDTIGFRAPTNAVTINNLSTGLMTVNIQDDTTGNLYTINHIGTATDNPDDVLDVNLSNSGAAGTGLALTFASADPDAGYETVNINSGGPIGNVFTLVNAGPSTITVTGDANLTLTGGGLNVAALDLLDASGFMGNLTAAFTGTGDVDVEGGFGNDTLNFNPVVGNVSVNGNHGNDLMSFGAGVVATATGGEGNDSFVFLAQGNGNSSFTTADSVDGGDGNDSLTIFHTGAGTFLGAGVGAGIVGIETLIHDGDIAIAGNNLTVNMAESGSAKILRLQGDYDLGSVTTINNLNNDDLVVLAGGFQPTSNLVLNYTTPAALNIFNLELSGGQTVANLTTQNLTEITNVTSSGAAPNAISNASNIEGNVVVTGATAITIGNSAANAYNFQNGVLDLAAASGNDSVWTGFGNQVVIDGAGNDAIRLSGNGFLFADTANLGGGANTVTFDSLNIAGNGGSFLFADLHHVNGFNVGAGADADVLALSVTSFGIGQLVNTNATAVTAASTLSVREVVSGDVLNLAGSGFNFLKFTTAATATNAEDLFSAALGGGQITVGAVNNGQQILAAAYDSARGQMVLFAIDDIDDGPDDIIDAGDDVDAIATISMSYADFLAFAPSNFDFIA